MQFSEKVVGEGNNLLLPWDKLQVLVLHKHRSCQNCFNMFMFGLWPAKFGTGVLVDFLFFEKCKCSSPLLLYYNINSYYNYYSLYISLLWQTELLGLDEVSFLFY